MTDLFFPKRKGKVIAIDDDTANFFEADSWYSLKLNVEKNLK